MKTMLLTWLIMFSNSCIVLAQNKQEEEIIKQRYIAAFEYICSDTVNSGKTIHVMNNIIKMDPMTLLELLDKYPIGIDKETLKSDCINLVVSPEPYSHYSAILAETNLPKNLSAELILIFSEIKNNMLEAHIVENRMKDQKYTPIYVLDMQSLTKPNRQFTPENALHYTQGYTYLLFFDSGFIVKDFFRGRVVYN